MEALYNNMITKGVQPLLGIIFDKQVTDNMQPKAKGGQNNA
jgi:hypothetical protein